MGMRTTVCKNGPGHMPKISATPMVKVKKGSSRIDSIKSENHKKL